MDLSRGFGEVSVNYPAWFQPFASKVKKAASRFHFKHKKKFSKFAHLKFQTVYFNLRDLLPRKSSGVCPAVICSQQYCC